MINNIEPEPDEYNNKGDSYSYYYKRNNARIKTDTFEKIKRIYNKKYVTEITKIIMNKNFNKNMQDFISFFIKLQNVLINYLIEQKQTQNFCFFNIFMYLSQSIPFFSSFFFNKNKIGGDMVTYNFNNDNDLKFKGNNYTKDENKKNVVIFGAGPVGLFMGIILKKMAQDKLNIYILENRVKDENGVLIRTLTRTKNNIFIRYISDIAFFSEYCKTDDLSMVLSREDWNLILDTDNEKKLCVVTTDLFNNIKEYITEIRGSYPTISIANLETIYANYAQKLGVSIIHYSNNEYEKYIDDNTLLLFDATGGNLDKENESYYVDNNKQNIGDGINLNSLKIKNINNKDYIIVSIGDSLYKANYEIGAGSLFGSTLCFFISFFFTLYFDLQNGENINEFKEQYNKAFNINEYNKGGANTKRAEKIQKRKQDETAENPFVAIVVIKELFYYKINKIILERNRMA